MPCRLISEQNNDASLFDVLQLEMLCGTELERSQSATRELEEKMLQVGLKREKLEEAQRNAEESIRLAEETASLEKAERELKANTITIHHCCSVLDHYCTR